MEELRPLPDPFDAGDLLRPMLFGHAKEALELLVSCLDRASNVRALHLIQQYSLAQQRILLAAGAGTEFGPIDDDEFDPGMLRNRARHRRGLRAADGPVEEIVASMSAAQANQEIASLMTALRDAEAMGEADYAARLRTRLALILPPMPVPPPTPDAQE